VTPQTQQNFTNSVIYTVTAEDKTTVNYTIYVTLSQRDALLAIYNENPGNTLNWDLENEDISTWEWVTVDDDGNVIYLSIANSNISVLPAEIGYLTSLIKLELAYNQLTSLPTSIGNLTSLSELNLYNNQLISLPSEIGSLTSLNELNLAHNQLASLPVSIGNLTSLTKLWIYEN